MKILVGGSITCALFMGICALIIIAADRLDEKAIQWAIKDGTRKCKEYGVFVGRETKYSGEFGCVEWVEGKWVKVVYGR